MLIIEDNVDTAASLKEALELGGHEVEAAHDGREGLSRARVFQPEVVLCDVGLPGVDGYEVARAFRADGALSGSFLVAAKPPSFDELEALLAEAPQRPPGRPSGS